jgi:hypothetical protein
MVPIQENSGMKIKIERFIIGVLLAPPAPLAFFLLGWWGSYEFMPEKLIPYGAIGGLILGILIDILILQRLIDRYDKLGMAFWSVVYLFYSIVIFGFFMGVPIFNSLLSLPAGMLIGSILVAENADINRAYKTVRRTAWFCTAVLMLVCIASATIALLSESTASDLQSMLGLGFEVTPGMILGLIGIGGLVLLVSGWLMANTAVRLTFKYFQSQI